MKVLVIEPDGSGRVAEIADDDRRRLAEFQALVGGYIEIVGGGGGWGCYVNEDGKAAGLAPNPFATALCVGLGPWHHLDGLRGAAVFFGSSGEMETDVPQPVLDAWDRISAALAEPGVIP